MTTRTRRHTTVLLSGGIDSTAALAIELTNKRDNPHHDIIDTFDTLTIDYGQTHTTEIDAARRIAAHYDLPHTVIDLSGLAPALASPLTGHGTIPTTDPTTGPAATYVPNRNMILLAIAAAHTHTTARHKQADHAHLITGIHADDAHGYPDCTPQFKNRAADTIRHAIPAPHVTVKAPFTGATKTNIIEAAAKANAPLHLTWSCYRGGTRHCGTCTTCVARARAFINAHIDDPTDYDINATQAARAADALASARIAVDSTPDTIATCPMCDTVSHITGEVTANLDGTTHHIAAWSSCINTTCRHHGLTCDQAVCALGA